MIFITDTFADKHSVFKYEIKNLFLNKTIVK